VADQPAPAGATPSAIEAAPRLPRAEELRQILGELGRLDGVRGGIIVTPDGLVITAVLPPGVAAEALAALAATLGRELERGTAELAHGAFASAFFSADDGTIFIGKCPVGFVILVGGLSARPAEVGPALRAALARLHGTWRAA